jgi:hypothetical protein
VRAGALPSRDLGSLFPDRTIGSIRSRSRTTTPADQSEGADSTTSAAAEPGPSAPRRLRWRDGPSDIDTSEYLPVRRRRRRDPDDQLGGEALHGVHALIADLDQPSDSFSDLYNTLLSIFVNKPAGLTA